MSVLNLVQSPLQAVLETLCGRYLILETDAETLAVELRRLQVALRNVLLNAASLNPELGRFGVELRQGRASQAELRIVDLASCRTELSIESLHLTVRSRTPVDPVSTQGQSPVETETLSYLGLIWERALPIAQTVWKWFMTNLRVTANEVLIDFELSSHYSLQLKLKDVQYHTALPAQGTHTEPVPQLTAKTLQLGVPDATQSSGVTTAVMVRDVVWCMGVSAGGCQNDIQMGDLELCLTPELLQQILEAKERDIDDHGLSDSVVFYDVEASETASVAASDLTESLFFECEEQATDTEVDTPMTQPSPFAFDCEIKRVHAELRSESAGDSQQQFLLQLEDLSCQGTLHDDYQLELSVGDVEIKDLSSSSVPLGIRSSGLSLPQTLASLLVDGRAGGGSYVRLGFPQLHQKPCLTAKLSHEVGLQVQSAPVVLWSSCETLHQGYALFQSLSQSLRPSNSTSETKLLPLNVDWTMSGIYGVLGQPRSANQSLPGIFSVELKTGAAAPFLSYHSSRESHSFLHAVSVDLGITSVSLDELKIYHCPCRNAFMTACHCLLSCTSQSSVTAEVPALAIEITRAAQERHCGSNLSSLAYQLVHTYSQSDPEGLQERNLGRVEYEGKTVQSADLVCDVTFSSAVLDVRVETLEAILDTLLHFWRPPNMADQMKHDRVPQVALLLNGEQVSTRLAGEETRLDLQMDEMELCLVSGVQRKTISTLALSVAQMTACSSDQNELLKMGQGIGNQVPGLQFFQVSELDHRNAKFKQWAALQQNMISVSLQPSTVKLRWIYDTTKRLLRQNRERIETDVEVETTFSWATQQMELEYSSTPLDSSGETPHTLHCTLCQGSCTVGNLKKGTGELWNLKVSVGTDATALESVGHEAHLRCRLQPKNTGLELEIKNQRTSVQLNPHRLATLISLAHSLKPQQQTAEQVDAMEVDSEGATGSTNILHGITHDAFSSRDKKASAHRDALMEGLTQHEDEDGFIVVDDPRRDSNRDVMHSSQASWLEGSDMRLREDYICLPNRYGFLGDSLANSQSDAGFPPPSWKIKGVDLLLDVSLYRPDSDESIQLSAQGIQIGYTVFQAGSDYRSRCTLSVQECEIVDHREGENDKCIFERDRSQLRTECSKRLKHQQTLSFPMIQLSLEQVLPDVEVCSKTTEMRVELHVVPLRLRLSQSLKAFSKLYLDTLPSSQEQSSGECYFQRCSVGALFVVVDYCPGKVDLQKLRNGQTEQLVNMVQWEGLEFFLNEITTSGISGWSHLLSYVIHSWTHDITHSQRHRLLGGVPALGMLKRISPATQDVIQAAMSKVTRREAPEEDIRGVPVSNQVTLTRAVSEFGRVFSLEVLNLCTTGTQNMQLLIDGEEEPQPSTSSTLSEAGGKLKRAAQSVVTDPIESVRSGEGVGVAMRRAVRAAPKALLAPASAAVTLFHGTFKRAREALDTDHVFDT